MASLRSDQNGSPTGETNKRKKARFVVYKNEDGSLDTSHLSAEDRAAYEAGRPSSQSSQSPPMADTPPPAATEPIDPQVIGMALTLLVSIESAVVGNKLNLPQEQVFKVLRLKPPFDEMVTNAATKVANKYGASLGPYSDEIALVALLATWQLGAFAELRALAAEMASRKPDAPPPPVDHDRHQSPPPPPPPPKESPRESRPASNVVPIDLIMGAIPGTTFAAMGV